MRIGTEAPIAKEGRTHFRALPPWARHLRWLAVVLTASPWVLINVLRHIPMWGLGIIAMLYGLIAIPTILPQRVDVGHDGIFLRWFGNKRFIAFSKILHVSPTRVGVVIHLLTGREIEIRLTQKDGAADAQAKALFKQIEAGIASHRDLGRADEEAFLARGARDVSTWLREMRAIGAGDRGGYRVNSIPRDRLWAVVENPAADPSARQGAALALSASLADDERVRLLALAQKTASPRVRIAFDGVGRATGGPDEASKSEEETRLRIALETAERELEERDSGSMPVAKAAQRR